MERSGSELVGRQARIVGNIGRPDRRGERWKSTSDTEADAVLNSTTSPDWFSLSNDPRSACVKRNALREVHRVTLPQGVFYAKVFHEAPALNRLKSLIRGCPASLEFDIARRLTRRGARCIRVLAWGRRGPSSVMISTAVTDAVSLAEAWRLNIGRRQELVRAVALFVASLHESGVLPADLHPENLLVRPANAEAGAELLLVDVAGTRFVGSVGTGDAARGIAQLAPWFMQRSSPRDRLRFLRHYAKHRSGYAPPRQLVHKVEKASRRRLHRLWSRRDRRILGRNAYFTAAMPECGWQGRLAMRIRVGTLPACVSVPPISLEEWRAMLTQFTDALNTSPDATELMLGSRSVAIRRAGDASRRRFVMSHRMRNRDLVVPAVLAVLECTTTTGRETQLLEAPLRSLTPLSVAWQNTSPDLRGRRALLAAAAAALADLAVRGAIPVAWDWDLFAVARAESGAAAPVVIAHSPESFRLARRPARGCVTWCLEEFAKRCPASVRRTDRLRFLLVFLRRIGELRPTMAWKRAWSQAEDGCRA